MRPSPRAMVGRYELYLELASGGMGRVYLARATGSPGLDRLVALKCIHPELSTEQRFVEMFFDEARIAAKIVHPNVCNVFDFGEADGRHYLAMEYLEGETVSHLMRAARRAGARPTDHDALMAYIVAQAAEGLHAAHSLTDESGQPLEVVHRDVSPHNLFVTHDGGVRVVDFGIASARGRLHETTTGSVKGKFAYMSPEQMRREKVDRRSDVWALGVVLWELLTLERMRPEDSEVDIILAVLNEPVRRPSELRPDLDPALEAIVMCALDKDRDRRTATAGELARALRTWIVGRGVVVGMPELAALMAAVFPDAPARRQQVLEGARRASSDLLHLPRSGEPHGPIELEPTKVSVTSARRRAGPALGAIALTAAALLGGLFALQQAEPSDAGEPSIALAAPPGDAGVSLEPAVLDAAMLDARPSAHDAPDAASPEPAPIIEPRIVRPRGTGTVRIETPGGWAEVWIDGERLGRTPLTSERPTGRASLELRPFGLAPPAGDTSLRRRIEVGPRPLRVVVPLDE